MNKAKAMLDALMGPSRDVSAKAITTDDWKDRKVCKTFLVAVCPYDKTMLGGRKGIEVCPKVHNDMLREKFNKHADGAPDSSFRRDCEDKALRDLTECISARDQWAREQASLKNAQLNIRPGGQNKEIGKMKRQVCEIKEKADAIDDTESVANAALKAQLLKEYAVGLEEYEAFVKEEERKADAAAPRAQSCKVCGTAYEKEQDYNLHLTFTRHKSFEQITEQFEKLKEKKAEWEKKREEERAKGKEERREKKDEVKKEKKELVDIGEKKEKKEPVDIGEKKEKKEPVDIGEKKEKKEPVDIGETKKSDKKRSRSRDKDRRRSRSRDKEKADKDKNGERRSRDRDKGRDREKGRDRRSRERRSRSRGARKRSRSRSRSRRRERDRRR